MGQALKLAAAVRLRQYYELMIGCLTRPSETARELLERPEHWWPGAALLVAAATLAYSPGFSLFLSPLVAAFLAVYCRPKAGTFQWKAWAVLWGYGLLPWVMAHLLSTSLLGFMRLLFPALKFVFGISTLKAIAPTVTTLMGPLIIAGVVAILAFGAFTALRLVLAMVRAATRASWAHAAALSLMAVVSAVVFAEILEPLARALHG